MLCVARPRPKASAITSAMFFMVCYPLQKVFTLGFFPGEQGGEIAPLLSPN